MKSSARDAEQNKAQNTLKMKDLYSSSSLASYSTSEDTVEEDIVC
jgi:hypothetical protein